jgi:ElaB/YqjD/DUF883 family membrane-anchored ribosome-binding protein
MIISEPIILFIMRTALAYKPDDDEVSVVSTEVLESNFTAMRGELTDLKTDFKEHRKEFTAAVARLDNDIKSAVSELRAEIRSMAVKAESELKDFAGRIENQLREMRAEHIGLRDKVDKNFETLNVKDDKNYETLNAKIDKNHETLNAKIDKNHAEVTGKIDVNNDKLTEVIKALTLTDSKLNGIYWVIGILVAAATFLITVGHEFGWFR